MSVYNDIQIPIKRFWDGKGKTICVNNKIVSQNIFPGQSAANNGAYILATLKDDQKSGLQRYDFPDKQQ